MKRKDPPTPEVKDEVEDERSDISNTLLGTPQQTRARRALTGFGTPRLENRGRPRGSGRPKKPVEKLSTNPKTVRERERKEQLPPEANDLERRRRADHGVLTYRQSILLDLKADGTPKYPEYYNADKARRSVIWQNYQDEIMAARFESGKSAAWLEHQMVLQAQSDQREQVAKKQKGLQAARARLEAESGFHLSSQSAEQRHEEEEGEEEELRPPRDAFINRMNGVISRAERGIMEGGTRTLERMGDPDAERALDEFHRQVFDPDHIEDYTYEYPIDWDEDREIDLGDASKDEICRYTEEGVAEVLDSDDERDKVIETEDLDSESVIEDCDSESDEESEDDDEDEEDKDEDEEDEEDE